MTPEKLDKLLAKFGGRRIGLLGDLFLDRYLMLNKEREYSIETGREAYQVSRVENAPGALGTVMNNLHALGVGRLIPVTVIGDDGHGYDLRKSLASMTTVDGDGLIADAHRLTPTYTKPMRPAEQGWVELSRLDVRTRAPLSSATNARVIAQLRRVWKESDGLIVLDQVAEPECGVVNSVVRDELIRLAAGDPEKLVMVDSREQLGQFATGILKGNRRELMDAAGMDDDDGSEPAMQMCLEQWRNRLKSRVVGSSIRAVVCTDGPRGIWVVRPNESPTHAPAPCVQGAIDIVGAGDAVTSAMMAALLSDASVLEAAELANLAASVTIRKLGETGVASPDELRFALKRAQ